MPQKPHPYAEPLKNAVSEVLAEFTRASRKHPRFNSAHEGLSVLKEEVHELMLEVYKRKRDPELMREEAVQVAAMAFRFLIDICQPENK